MKNIFINNYTFELVEIKPILNPKTHHRLKEIEDNNFKFKVINPVPFGHGSEPEYLEIYDGRNIYEDSNGRLMQYTNEYTSIEEHVSQTYKNTFDYSIDDSSDDPKEMVELCHAKGMLAAGSCIPRLIELNAVIKESVEKCTELLKEKHK